MSTSVLEEIGIDVGAVFKDPAAEAREWLKQYNEERGNGGGTVSQTKTCPDCGESVLKLEAKCPTCEADLRAKCDVCGLPLSGSLPLCQCGGFEGEEEREEFFSTSPSSKRANRPGGGRGYRRLAGRRLRYGY